jgi:hypothetical protein
VSLIAIGILEILSFSEIVTLQKSEKSSMERKWVKIDTSNYALIVNDRTHGTLQFFLDSHDSRATIRIEDAEFNIRRVGTWKTDIEITDQKNLAIARTHSEKWYSSYFILDYNDTLYKLQVRNNPLSEFAITKDNEVVLAYGLDVNDTDGSLYARIIGAEINQDPLLDYFLWYLFVPVATENLGDNLIFNSYKKTIN